MFKTDKFEKWSEEEKRVFAELFRDVYNYEHDEIYDVFAGSFPTRIDLDFDFCYQTSDGRVLLVQHTFGGADRKEYIMPKSAESVIGHIHGITAGLRDITAVIGFKDCPYNDEEQQQLAGWLSELITIAAKSPGMQLEPNERNNLLLSAVGRYVWHLELSECKSDELNLFVYLVGPKPMSEDVRVQVAASIKEALHYSNQEDLVLLVHMNMMPVPDEVIPQLQDDFTASRFHGVWLFDEWNRRFIHIK